MDARRCVEGGSSERVAPSEISGWAAIARPSAVPAEGGVSHWAMQRDGRNPVRKQCGPSHPPGQDPPQLSNRPKR